MESNIIRLKTLLAAFFSVLLLEAVGSVIGFSQTSPLFKIGIIRIVDIMVLTGIVTHIEGSLSGIGVHPMTAVTGIKKGVLWSIAFGICVTAMALAMLVFGIHPLLLVKTRLPDQSRTIFTFFIVGGVIGPVAEEIFFRGIIFSFFRRFGLIFALAFSTFFFAALHTSSAGIPIPQLAGGILFAVAFEVEKNLLVPMVIHILGNLAIFFISLIST